MSAALSEYELEVLPELGAGYESEFEGDLESQQFFGALANLARRGAGWMTAPGSPQRQLALSVARRALNRGLPALGQLVGGVGNGAAGAALGSQAASWLDGLLPQEEYEAELEGEFELNPARRIYPDAMLEHLGHAAAETHSEAEAEALAGAMIPLAAASIPARAAPILLHATPGLVTGLSGVVHGLRQSPATRPLVRIVPAIVRSTATNIAQQASRGVPVSPQAAVRMLAQQIVRMLGSPQQSARAFRRSRALDGHFHRTYRAPRGGGCNCPACAARESTFEFEAPQHPNCRELTPAQCRVLLQAKNEAIKMATIAATKLDATLIFGPRTKSADGTAALFTRIFGHDPRTPVKWAGNIASGASIADRFRKVARELAGPAKGGRTITFRSEAICDTDTMRGFVVANPDDPNASPPPPAGERNVIHLCPRFWNPIPQAGLRLEAFRGGVILHEMLHVLFPGLFGHDTVDDDGNIVRDNTSPGGERRRNNAHCLRAFALRASGNGQDNRALGGCTRFGPNPKPF
jgi:hypothetical protein